MPFFIVFICFRCHRCKVSQIPGDYNPWPHFQFTGALRPFPRSSRRTVPAHIARPDYADTGESVEERRAKVRVSEKICVCLAVRWKLEVGCNTPCSVGLILAWVTSCVITYALATIFSCLHVTSSCKLQGIYL